jgi:hypothetical protein
MAVWVQEQQKDRLASCYGSVQYEKEKRLQLEAAGLVFFTLVWSDRNDSFS